MGALAERWHSRANWFLRHDRRLPAGHGGGAVDRIDQLARLEPNNRDAIHSLSAMVRRTIDGIANPDDLAVVITRPLAWHGEQATDAVRSSATAGDTPTASFAGQQDTS